MNINNLRSMAMFTDIMTNGATDATKMVNRLEMAKLATSMSAEMQQQSSDLLSQAVAKLMGVGGKIDTMA